MHSHPARDGLSIDQEGPRNSRSQEGGATKHGAPDYQVDRTTLQLTGPCRVSYEHGAGEWQTDYHFLTWFARAVCNDSQALERFLCLWMEERRCRFGPATFLACGRDQVYDFLVRCWGTDSSMGHQ